MTNLRFTITILPDWWCHAIGYHNTDWFNIWGYLLGERKFTARDDKFCLKEAVMVMDNDTI